MAERVRAILDVDTGVDDAMALALAVHLPEIELVAVTTVGGNVGIDNTTANTWRVLDAVGAGRVPIYRGLGRPLAGKIVRADNIHGESGVGGLVLPDPASKAQLRRPFAPEAIIDHLDAAPGELTLVFTGPLTNLAAAIALDPTLPTKYRRLVVMGGSLGRGNITPFAEFNINADPEAAAQVFDACTLTMVGLDVTERVTLTREFCVRLEGLTTPEATIVHEATAHFFYEGAVGSPHLHDPLAVGVAHDPTLCTTKRGRVTVETATAWCAGRTTLVEDPNGPHEVCVTVESERFLALFAERLGLPR